MHGYDLARLVESDDALCAIWRLKRSEVYFLLSKLVARDYVVEVGDTELARFSAKRQESGPPRQIYQITAAGHDALAEWITTPVHKPHDMRAAFLAKLYLAMQCDAASALTLVQRQRQTLRGWHERLATIATSDSFPGLVYRLRLAQVAAALAVLDEIQDTLEVTKCIAEP